MIDDLPSNCQDITENGIKVLMMETRFNKKITEFEKVSNWREIYAKIKELYGNNKRT